MIWLRIGIFVLALLLGLKPLPFKARAAWGPGSAPVGARSTYEWRSSKGCDYLFQNGIQVAGYDPQEKVYRTYNAAKKEWSEPTKAPWEMCAATTEIGATGEIVQNFGLDCSKIGHRGEIYSINGQEVTAEQAAQAVAAGAEDLTDDSGKLRLTVIGSDADRQKILTDLATHPSLAPWKDKYNVWSVAPDHWSVAKYGFVTKGAPTIYLQTPDAKVLHHQDDYSDGAEGLAQALRKAEPNYKPEADKDQRKSEAPSSGLLVAGASSGLLLLLILLRRKAG